MSWEKPILFALAFAASCCQAALSQNVPSPGQPSARSRRGLAASGRSAQGKPPATKRCGAWSGNWPLLGPSCRPRWRHSTRLPRHRGIRAGRSCIFGRAKSAVPPACAPCSKRRRKSSSPSISTWAAHTTRTPRASPTPRPSATSSRDRACACCGCTVCMARRERWWTIAGE